MVSTSTRRPGRGFAAPRACRLVRIASCAIALLLPAVSGCSNDPYPAGESATPTLYRVLSDNPKTLDPSIAYDVASGTVIDTVYPSYLQYHYLKRDPFVLELGLGAADPKREKWPVQVTEKGKTVTKTGERWTFTIKKGLHFQDDPCFPGGRGREIVAADFLFSFKRMAAPNVACPIFSFFSDKILGLQNWRDENTARLKEAKKRNPNGPKARVDYAADIPGLQLDPSDPYTFRILLNQPYPQLRYLMAMHFTTPLAHEAVDRYGDENLGKDAPDDQKFSVHPVGSGSFKVTEYIKNLRIMLVANPNYRPEFYPTEGQPGDRENGLLADAGKRLPLVKSIRFNIIRESITSFNEFLQGYEDLAGVSQQNFQQVMTVSGRLSPEMQARGLGLHRDKGVDISYFSFNMDDPTFGGTSEKNRKLRQAISLSIDSREMIDLLEQGLGVDAQFMVAPGLFGYDPNYKNPYRQFDPSLKQAKQLLAEAGYPDGIDPKTGSRLTLIWENLNTTPLGKQEDALVRRQIQRLGLNVDSRPHLFADYEDRLDSGQFTFMSFGWVADYPDPENFVFLLYGPNSAKRNNGPNYSNYANPEYDKLFDQMRIMDDGPERKAIIVKMRAIVEQDCVWIPWLHSETFALTQQWVKNYKPHPVAMDTMKYWNVDAPLRARLQAQWNRPNYWPVAILVLLIAIAIVPAAGVVQARTNRRVRRQQEGGR
ncbi:MAG TPA: ABC transporter substrate-binding protein [Chthonomonadaceae bacterium]|nr:ABC transporter substrate-binding protein [Chthonomonadaceae bacterium]